MQIDRTAGRLHDENIRSAHVLLDLDVGFTIGKTRDERLPATHSEERANLICERLVGRAAKDLELVVDAGTLRFAIVLFVSAHFLFGSRSKGRHKISI